MCSANYITHSPLLLASPHLQINLQKINLQIKSICCTGSLVAFEKLDGRLALMNRDANVYMFNKVTSFLDVKQHLRITEYIVAV